MISFLHWLWLFPIPHFPIVNTAIHDSNIILSVNHLYDAIHLNGVQHWVGFIDNGDINELGEDCDIEIIICFDMSHEVFRIIRLPDEVFRKLRFPGLDNVSKEKTFSVFNDCLPFIVYNE